MNYCKNIGRSLALFSLAMIISPYSTAASNLDNISSFTGTQGQELFRLLSEDVGAALSYRSLQPAEPLGTTGFDISAEVTVSQLPNSEHWLSANSDGDELTAIILPKLHVTKGLPYGIDIGAFYSGSSNTDISVSGAELKYAFLEGSTATPAVALRLNYTKLEGIDQLAMNTTGADLSVSKGLAFLTPYVGVGSVWVKSTPQAEAETIGLEEESFQLTKSFVGMNIGMGIVSVNIEGDRVGDANSYSLKLALRW